VALRTYFIMAAPGVTGVPVGEVAAAVTTLQTLSSIFLVTFTTAAEMRMVAYPVITGATIPWSESLSLVNISNTLTISSRMSLNRSL
jgi:hypothetical protein